jgi:ribosomal protein L25 (general stress protein Ctc)
MNSIEANIRNTNTKGEVNSLRINGNVPGIVYGGSEKNQKIYLSKKNIKNLIQKDNMGRARPSDIVEFGGTLEFTKAFINEPHKQTKFVFSFHFTPANSSFPLSNATL